ncbi:MAG: hypothetical protein DWQ05_01245 [Calditrichaeota bacterium]|nr:MAG: hypothetical protein DWQ05_01245 [Calditrichota bacterium]
MKLLLNLILIAGLIGCAQAQEEKRTAHWFEKYQQFETEKDSIKFGGTVFLGNSIIEGFDLQHYFPEWRAVNRGIVGDHIDGLIARLQNSATALKPKNLMLMIGINDIGDRRSDAYLQNMFTILLDSLRQQLPETKIYLHSILPTTARWKNCPPAQIRRINKFLEEIAAKNHFQFVNLFPHFANEKYLLKEKFTHDGLHLNDNGYLVWAGILRKRLPNTP